MMDSAVDDHSMGEDGGCDLRGVTFRSIEVSDFQAIKQLHEAFFPICYSDKFYEDACNGIGFDGETLFSRIVVSPSGEMIGFVLAQLLAYPSRCEDRDLFDLTNRPTKVCL